jgi:hypothetical protein
VSRSGICREFSELSVNVNPHDQLELELETKLEMLLKVMFWLFSIAYMPCNML